MASLEQTIQQSVLKTAQTVEQQLDAELERLEKLDSDDLSTLRQHRLKDMKKQAQQQQEWRVLVRFMIKLCSFSYIHPVLYNSKSVSRSMASKTKHSLTQFDPFFFFNLTPFELF